jgi:hypothetical protein
VLKLILTVSLYQATRDRNQVSQSAGLELSRLTSEAKYVECVQPLMRVQPPALAALTSTATKMMTSLWMAASFVLISPALTAKSANLPASAVLSTSTKKPPPGLRTASRVE